MEDSMTEKIKEIITEKAVCEGIIVTNIEFDNNPDDNKKIGVVNMKGRITFNNEMEREVIFTTNFKNFSEDCKMMEETQTSMLRRLALLLKEKSYEPIDDNFLGLSSINFKDDETGIYVSRDGDRYGFNYSLSEPQNLSERTFYSSSSCAELKNSLDLNKQQFSANLIMENRLFTLNGIIIASGVDNRLSIEGEIMENETSKSEKISLLLAAQ